MMFHRWVTGVCLAAVVLLAISWNFREEQMDYASPTALEDDGDSSDIRSQAKKLIQRAKIEKAHATQEKKKGADLITKAERTCKIAEVERSNVPDLCLPPFFP